MLAVTAELEDAAEAERALALRANALWPGFAAELEAASGRQRFPQPGGRPAAGGRRRRAGGDAGAGPRASLRILDRTAGPRPGAAAGRRRSGGLWSPHEAHVDNRALGEALAIAFLKAGGVLNANEAAVRLEPGPAVLHALWPL